MLAHTQATYSLVLGAVKFSGNLTHIRGLEDFAGLSGSIQGILPPVSYLLDHNRPQHRCSLVLIPIVQPRWSYRCHHLVLARNRDTRLSALCNPSAAWVLTMALTVGGLQTVFISNLVDDRFRWTLN